MILPSTPKRVVIVGGGFAGLNAAKRLGAAGGTEVTLIDRTNYHLFQPLLYQVATTGLSPTDIAAPIRSILAPFKNITVFLGEVRQIDLSSRFVETEDCRHPYDYLILACGSRQSYFGNDHWAWLAPGLKTIEQGLKIRSRLLRAFEMAECEADPDSRQALLTFVIVGGGPTGVELAGAIAEMTRFTLKAEFRNIRPELSRIILLEAGERILTAFDPLLAAKAHQTLETMGVEIRTGTPVRDITPSHVLANDEHIPTSNVIWAAGVQASEINRNLGVELTQDGRIRVNADLSIPEYPDVFVAGDQAGFPDANGRNLPGLAPVALQQGVSIAGNIVRDLRHLQRIPFRYRDKGLMATIGRNRALLQSGHLKLIGVSAWLLWIITHIAYLVGFKNRMMVMLNWSWSYITYDRGSRLIVYDTHSADTESVNRFEHSSM